MRRVDESLLSSFVIVGDVMLEALSVRPNFGPAPPGPGGWTALTSSAVSYLGRAIAFGGDIFVFGGRIPSAQSNLIRKYNIASKVWSNVGTLPWVGESAVAVVIGDLIYVHGGQGAGTTRYGNTVSFNPVTNVVTTLATGLAARASSAVAIDGKMYVFGGETTVYVNSLRCYDPATNQWTTLSPTGSIPTARAFHEAGVVGGKMYVVSGYITGNQAVKTMDVYDPVANAWEPAIVLGFGVYANGIGVIGKRIYVCGGIEQPNTVYVDTTRVYDTETGQWTVVQPMFKKMAYLQVTMADNKLYSIGGYAVTSGGPVGDTAVYTPS